MGAAIADRQVAYMTSLLDDLLDVSRISQGKITLKKVPVLLTNMGAFPFSRPCLMAP
jgi:hypothetical protein